MTNTLRQDVEQLRDSWGRWRGNGCSCQTCDTVRQHHKQLDAILTRSPREEGPDLRQQLLDIIAKGEREYQQASVVLHAVYEALLAREEGPHDHQDVCRAVGSGRVDESPDRASTGGEGEVVRPSLPQHASTCPQHPFIRMLVARGDLVEGLWGNTQCTCEVEGVRPSRETPESKKILRAEPVPSPPSGGSTS